MISLDKWRFNSLSNKENEDCHNKRTQSFAPLKQRVKLYPGFCINVAEVFRINSLKINTNSLQPDIFS